MKRFFSFFLIYLIIASCVQITSADDDFGTKHAQASKGTPKIDGEIDDIWSLTEILTTERFKIGNYEIGRAHV